jgi:lycopene beta-cyclase
MGETAHDYVLVGGGLQSGLIALALCARRAAPSLAIVEQQGRLGGNHTWCFYDGDVPPALRAVLAPLVVARWDGYRVRFPGRDRRLAAPYSAVTSDHFDRVVRARVAETGGAVRLGRRAIAIAARHVVLDGDEVVSARAVIDARGPLSSPADNSSGYQKFLGLELVLRRPHGLTEPVLMDATVEQLDGYRFVYSLPLAADRLLVEDTYFSDRPALDVEALRARVLHYARSLGLHIERVAREETGVLPMPWSGGPSPRAAAPLVAGYRGGFFHPATGYSFAIAARLADTIARLAPEALAGPEVEGLARGLRRQACFAKALNRLLFRWFDPALRWRVLDRFYRLPEDTIRRFYALDMTTGDQARILVGRPPHGLSVRSRLRRVPA